MCSPKKLIKLHQVLMMIKEYTYRTNKDIMHKNEEINCNNIITQKII